MWNDQIWDVRDVRCLGCGILRMWDVGFKMFAGM